MILVVGATGKLCSRLARGLLQAGSEVCVLVSHRPPLYALAGHEPVSMVHSLAGAGARPMWGDMSNRASLRRALEGAEAVIVAVQANGFCAVFEALAPHLLSGQAVIVSAHCSFAALYLHRLLAARGLDLPIAAWATTALTARKSGRRSVHISGIRTRLDVATLPERHAEAGLALCRALFGDRFEPRTVNVGVQLADRVEIRSGLQAGEQVVSSGVFLLDSESRLRAAGGAGTHSHGTTGIEAAPISAPAPTVPSADPHAGHR